MAKDMACSGPSQAEMEKWRAEDDLRTLTEAVKIKKDKRRLDRALKLAREQQTALKEVQA